MEEISVLIAQAQAGDNGAREVLIEKNLGLVHHIVKRFSGRGYDMEDLFQIGTIGGPHDKRGNQTVSKR